MGKKWYKQKRKTGKKTMYLHRVVASSVLGRDLLPGEVVHHIDGDAHNNHPDNLQVLSSQGVHMQVEHFGRKYRGQPELFSEDSDLPSAIY